MSHAAWFRDAPIRREVAARLHCDGFFVQPHCDPTCCRPVGPFPSETAARLWSERLARAQAEGDAAALIELAVEADLLRDDA